MHFSQTILGTECLRFRIKRPVKISDCNWEKFRIGVNPMILVYEFLINVILSRYVLTLLLKFTFYS